LRGVYAVFRGGFHTSGEPAIHRGSASDKAITVFFFWNAVLRGVYAVFRGGFHTFGEPAIHRGSVSDKAITVFFFWNAGLRGAYAVFRNGFHTFGEPAIHRGSAIVNARPGHCQRPARPLSTPGSAKDIHPAFFSFLF
jgi:hypothetical protein